jgi:hypothetical protein
LLLILNTILLTSSSHVKAGVKVSPAALHIEMNEGYPPYTPEYSIKVTNPYDAEIQAYAKVIRPWDLRDGYIVIPDLSWINVFPEILNIPAQSSNIFYIRIKIPENEKPLHYNESWEVWTMIDPSSPSGLKAGGGIGLDFQAQYMVRILIKTPPEEQKMETPQILYIFLAGLVGFIVLSFVYFYVRRRRILADRTAMFYFKNKNNKN